MRATRPADASGGWPSRPGVAETASGGGVRVTDENAHKEAKPMKVREIMTAKPAFVTVDESLHRVAQLMADYDCGIVPVTETADRLRPVGVITDRDLALRTIAHNKNPLHMIAAEAMTELVVTIGPDERVEDCVKVMENNQIRRIVVVDERGDLIGIVAQADIARAAPALETAELVRDLSARMAA
jgi:CBS domain-containing protein